MQVVTFNRKKYVLEPGVGAPAGAIDIASLSVKELADLHNLVASNLDLKRVSRFADKEAAVRRTRGVLLKYEQSPEIQVSSGSKKPKKAAEKTTDKKGPRRTYFNFKPLKSIRETPGKLSTSESGDTRSLRNRLLDDMMKRGLTLVEAQGVVREFDKDRNVASKNVERRAYEAVRILHYYLGYGLKQVGDKIYAYRDEKDLKDLKL